MWWICRVAAVKLLLRLTIAITLVVLLMVGLISLFPSPPRVNSKSPDRRVASVTHSPTSKYVEVVQHLKLSPSNEDITRHLRLIRKKAKKYNNGDEENHYVKERIVVPANFAEGSTSPKTTQPSEQKKYKYAPQNSNSRYHGQSMVSIPTQQNRSLDVVVVEEHHEVLPYWFNEANRRGKDVTRTHPSYTLVHFDAHSDFGPLSYKQSLPLFDWPKSGKDISMLMQRNDVFVMASIGTRLVDRFIWVWPEWMKGENSKLYGNHTAGLVNLGTFSYRTQHNLTKTGMCVCMTKVLKDGKASALFTDKLNRDCLFAKPELEPYMQEDVDCNLKIENIPFDFVRAGFMKDNGPSMLADGSFEDVIVDFDEDYFGLENTEQILKSAGLTWDQIDEINTRLTPIFCPTSVRHEQKLSAALPLLLLSNCSTPLYSSCVTTSRSELAVVHQTKCASMKKLSSAFQNLRGYIHSQLNSSQLKEVTNIGFCLQHSPASTKMSVERENNAMRVCLGGGKLDPSDFFYTPSKTQIAKESTTIAQILNRFKEIDLVTIARSNRDGFVSRNLQPHIESKILELIKEYGHKHDAQVQSLYDGNLLKNLKHYACVG